MSTALETRPQAGRDLVGPGLTDDQIALIKRQLMSSKRPATDDELALFVHQCNRTGLDPFSDQIYAIYRWDSRVGDEKMKVQVSIHGLRLVADRSRTYAPGSEYWCGPDGVWRDVWLSDDPPVAARVTIRKLVGSQLIEFSVPALWREFAAKNSSGKLTGLWPVKPALMLAKCSEALGLRKAFPNETSGLYIREEMDQADIEVVENVRQTFDATEVPPEQPAPAQQSAPPSNGTAEATANADDPLSAEEVEAMKKFFTARGVPEAMWRMRLMALNLDELSQLTKGQAHEIFAEADAKYPKAA